MKTKHLLSLASMICTLGVLVILNSCSDDPEPITFENNPDQFCSDNPNDSQCCLPAYNIPCYCDTGTNATDDLENCCLFEFNEECYCTANPDDPNCAQDFGAGSGLGIVVDFESGLQSFAPDFFNPSDAATFNGDANVTAIEGNSYFGLQLAEGAENKDWHDFKFWPSAMDDNPDNDSEAQIDFSSMTNPTLNVWVNSGMDETDSLGFTIAFQTDFEDGTTEQWAFHPLFKAGTGGDWKLYSFDLLELVNSGEYQTWGAGQRDFTLEFKHQMIKFAFMPAEWHVPGDYNAQIDAISITDGPLTQKPWVK